jgi:ubiquinone/menaquinone biosynthesis C-methylase UbiE
MQAAAQICEWAEYITTDYVFACFGPGQRVLDIGFGTGEQMRRLTTAGCEAIGIEYDRDLAARGAANGLRVCRSAAERLPFPSASLDGVICKVVIPYTDESIAVGEIARVLKPGAQARISYHGLGYSLRYLFTDRNWKRRVYALRVIVNTLVYRLTGRRLPGFWGDTLYQSSPALHRYYERAGLEVIEEPPSARFAGAPVFIYHTLLKK